MAVLNITSENYEKEVVGSKLPVLLDFWAPWCKYCRRIAPVVERVAQEYEGKVVVAQCNVDDAPALAQQFKVDIIPSRRAGREDCEPGVSGRAGSVDGTAAVRSRWQCTRQIMT